MQTQREKMRRHHKSLKKTAAKNDFGQSWAWMQLARRWKMPIRECKHIVRGEDF